MDSGLEYWRDWIGYWDYLSERAGERCLKASQRLNKEDYKVESFLSDVVGFWTDTALASLAVWRGPTRTPQPIIFRLDESDECAGPKCIPVFAPRLPSTPPRALWIGCLGEAPPPDHGVGEENIKVQFTKDRTGLEVSLVGLNSKKKGLHPATYRAMIRLDEVPVGEVFIVVQESTSFGDAPTSAAKKAAPAKAPAHPKREKKP